MTMLNGRGLYLLIALSLTSIFDALLKTLGTMIALDNITSRCRIMNNAVSFQPFTHVPSPTTTVNLRNDQVIFEITNSNKYNESTIIYPGDSRRDILILNHA